MAVLPFRPTPFFANKNQAFWRLQFLGWSGAMLLREHFHRVRAAHTGKPWREAKVFEKAYLILLIQEMIEKGVSIHLVPTHGDYMEIDTEEDYALANRDWPLRFTRDRSAT